MLLVASFVSVFVSVARIRLRTDVSETTAACVFGESKPTRPAALVGEVATATVGAAPVVTVGVASGAMAAPAATVCSVFTCCCCMAARCARYASVSLELAIGMKVKFSAEPFCVTATIDGGSTGENGSNFTWDVGGEADACSLEMPAT